MHLWLESAFSIINDRYKKESVSQLVLFCTKRLSTAYVVEKKKQLTPFAIYEVHI